MMAMTMTMMMMMMMMMMTMMIMMMIMMIMMIVIMIMMMTMMLVNQTYRVEESKIFLQKTCHWQVWSRLGLCFLEVWWDSFLYPQMHWHIWYKGQVDWFLFQKNKDFSNTNIGNNKNAFPFAIPLVDFYVSVRGKMLFLVVDHQSLKQTWESIILWPFKLDWRNNKRVTFNIRK